MNKLISTASKWLKDTRDHYLNPLHVYCRLVDVGLNPRKARTLASWYENNLYQA